MIHQLVIVLNELEGGVIRMADILTPHKTRLFEEFKVQFIYFLIYYIELFVKFGGLWVRICGRC